MKGRKNNCPTNIRNWQIDVYDEAAVDWVRVHGLTDMTLSRDSDTEDGSNATDLWEEPYVSKRSGTLGLEGKPVVDAATGGADRGQELLTDAANLAGCDGDIRLRIIDPYGHGIEVEAIVTSTEHSTDTDKDTISWDLDLIGETEAIAYVSVEGVTVSPDSLAFILGDAPQVVTVAFNPQNASNQRWTVSKTGSAIAISNKTDNTITVNALKTGTGSIKVTSVNGGRTATLPVMVSSETMPGILGTGVLGQMVLGANNDTDDEVVEEITSDPIDDPSTADDRVDLVITATKTYSSGSSTFVLSPVTAGAPMPDNATITIAGASGTTGSWGAITYTYQGSPLTYTYNVTETNNDNSNESNSYLVIVSVLGSNMVTYTEQRGE